ncbi:hypothetical protein [Sorangium sp. So ce394]|uniref:hypothetical protein n=1 Tax=Sorangium sp. So ce394 TaxID=3133310 RepID=UPI003F5B46E1
MKRTDLALALLFAACLGGCEMLGGGTYHTCAEHCKTELDPDACIEACGTCAGQCVNPVPEGFDGPALLWVGRTTDEPQCPNSAPSTVYVGYETPDFPFVCDPCRCSEPTCALPDGLRTAASLRCDGIELSRHDARNIQGGTCVVPSEALASDRKALLLGAPEMTPCEPSVEPPPVPRIVSRWYRSGKACSGILPEDTCMAPKRCVPVDDRPLDHAFSQCIMHLGAGEATCPPDYPEDVVLYDGMVDDRHCSPCECGPPTGGECSLTLLSFQDEACSALLATDTTSGMDPACLAPVPGMKPKSMKAVWHVNDPGHCEPSGGELRGGITLTGATTFCCQTRPDKRPGENE